MTSASGIPVFTVREYSAAKVSFFGSRRSRLEYSEFAANQVHQVSGVTPVQNAEPFREAEGGVVTSKRGVGNRMKGSAGDSSSLLGTSK